MSKPTENITPEEQKQKEKENTQEQSPQKELRSIEVVDLTNKEDIINR